MGPTPTRDPTSTEVRKPISLDEYKISNSVHNFDLFVTELYGSYVEPNDLENQPDFLRYEIIEVMLRAVGIDQGYALSDLIEDYYFEPEQMGDLQAMTPGIIDVSSIAGCGSCCSCCRFLCRCALLQMLSTFFLKASSYAMVQYNGDRAPSYWYYYNSSLFCGTARKRVTLI